MESSPDDMFGLGDDPGDEIFHSDEEEDDNDEGPSGAGPSGEDEQPVDENPPAPVLSNKTMLRKLFSVSISDSMLGNCWSSKNCPWSLVFKTGPDY